MVAEDRGGCSAPCSNYTVAGSKAPPRTPPRPIRALIPADVMAAAGGDLVRPSGATLPIGRLRRVLRGWLRPPSRADTCGIDYWQVHLGVRYRVILQPKWCGPAGGIGARHPRRRIRRSPRSLATPRSRRPNSAATAIDYPPYQNPDDLKPTAAEVDALSQGVVARLRPAPYVPLTAQTVLLRDLGQKEREFVVRLGYFSADRQPQTFQLIKDATRLAVAERLAYYLTVLHLGSAEPITLRTTDSDQGGLRRLANQILPAWFSTWSR